VGSKTTSEDAPPDFGRIAFIDLEASGLGSNSFPTELGWAIISEDGSVESSSCLIKPPSRWTLYANAWSAASERLTGITREMLERNGLLPSDAMKGFLEAVGDRELFSDAPDFDSYWLGMLIEAAGTSIQLSKIGDAKDLVERMEVSGPCHRAETDARRLALAFVAARVNGLHRTGGVVDQQDRGD
jgi:hypothetical protein